MLERGGGKAAGPDTALSPLNRAKRQETLSLGLPFPTGEVPVAHSSQHGLSRRDRAGAASVVTRRSKV